MTYSLFEGLIITYNNQKYGNPMSRVSMFVKSEDEKVRIFKKVRKVRIFQM